MLNYRLLLMQGHGLRRSDFGLVDMVVCVGQVTASGRAMLSLYVRVHCGVVARPYFALFLAILLVHHFLDVLLASETRVVIVTLV